VLGLGLLLGLGLTLLPLIFDYIACSYEGKG
jgi:hypothetical protein